MVLLKNVSDQVNGQLITILVLILRFLFVLLYPLNLYEDNYGMKCFGLET